MKSISITQETVAKIFVGFLSYTSLFLLSFVLLLTSCDDDDIVEPDDHNDMEVITDVKLIFTNTTDSNDVVEARAQDPDGEGVQELNILDTIVLSASQSYTLTFEIMNNLDSIPEDIGEEIGEEDDEHQFFFAFTEGAFSTPTGDGNIDNASDPLQYNDMDGDGNPLGLSTSWTTASAALASGTFTARLQHQPDIKDNTTGASDGDTDFELVFPLVIQAP